MKRLLGLLFILFLPSLLAACSKNSSGGYTLGRVGSPAWHHTAPTSDKNAYFDQKSVLELCNDWAGNYPDSRQTWKDNRNLIGGSLSRRGLSEMHCADPQADEINIMRATAARAKQEANRARQEANRARQEANRAKQEAARACDDAHRAYRSCMSESSSGYYSNCRRPSC